MTSEQFDAFSRGLTNATSRRGALRLFGVGAAGVALTAVGLNEVLAKGHKGKKGRKAKAQAASGNPLEGIAVTGTDDGGDQVFTGTLDVKKFVASNGQIIALGKLTGTIDKNGKTHDITRGVQVPVSIPVLEGGDVSAQQVECDVLNLVLGPLDLNLLGLHVHLDQVVLDITADPGGGILGDLLCALAGGGPLGQIVDLLNQILAILQDL